MNEAIRSGVRDQVRKKEFDFNLILEELKKEIEECFGIFEMTRTVRLSAWSNLKPDRINEHETHESYLKTMMPFDLNTHYSFSLNAETSEYGRDCFISQYSGEVSLRLQ